MDSGKKRSDKVSIIRVLPFLLLPSGYHPPYFPLDSFFSTV